MSAKSIAQLCAVRVQFIFELCKRKMSNLNKQHFLCLGVLWYFLGSSLVLPWSFVCRRDIRYKGEKS